MLSAQEIVLQYVCPACGMIIANLMFTAPLNDVRKAVSRGTLGSLNPTPWAAMTGNCCGRVTYSYLIGNWFLFLANAPGFILSIWLNMAAAKLQYCDRMSTDMKSSFVRLLETNRNSFVVRDQKDKSTLALLPESANEVERNSTVEPIQEDVTSFENMRKMALEIAIGKTEAPASHEKVVVAVITVWVVVIGSICLLDVTMVQRKTIIGVFANINLLFFYGAPLSTIFTVLKSRDSISIHRRTMLMNTANAAFWTAFGFGTADYIILVPNSLGALLGLIQVVLCVLVPSKGVEFDDCTESDSTVDLEMGADAPSTGSSKVLVSSKPLTVVLEMGADAPSIGSSDGSVASEAPSTASSDVSVASSDHLTVDLEMGTDAPSTASSDVPVASSASVAE